MSSENFGASAPTEVQQPESPATGSYPPYPWGYPPTGGAVPYPYPYYPSPSYSYYPVPTIQTSGWAIASLVCSIVGVVTLNFIPAILGAIFGHVALREIKNSNGWCNGHGMALAGVIIGYIALGLSIIVIALYILYLIFIFSFLQPVPTTSPNDFVPHMLGVLYLLR